MLDAVLQRRLVFVTGKGGVGKTGVALALGLGAARAGAASLVVEINPLRPHRRVPRRSHAHARAGEITPELAVAAIAPVRHHGGLPGRHAADPRARAPAAREQHLPRRHRGGTRSRGFPHAGAHRRMGGRAHRLQAPPASLRPRDRRRAGDRPLGAAARDAGHAPQDAAVRTAHRHGARTWRSCSSDPARVAVAIVTRAEEMAVNETLELATALMRDRRRAPAGDRERRRPAALHPRREPAPARGAARPAADARCPTCAVGRFGVGAPARRRAADPPPHARRCPNVRCALPHVPARSFQLAAIEQLADALAHPRARSRATRLMTAPMTEPRAPGPRPAPGRPTSRHRRTRSRALLAEQRLLVCVGSGGVGKTTTAAALGIARRAGAAAARPCSRSIRRAACATRSASPTLDGDPHRVPLGRVGRAGAGALDAMVLDTKRTFDELIRRYAPTEAAAERVLQNRIYAEHLDRARRLPGVHGDGAAARARRERRYELLVVDTPPTQHALDFLEAPERLTALLTSRAAAILQNPSLILAREGSRLAQAALERGAARARAFHRLRAAARRRRVRRRARGVLGGIPGARRRRSRGSSASPRPRSSWSPPPRPARIGETLAFHRELVRAGLPFAGFVVNRVLPPALLEQPPVSRRRARDRADLALGRKLAELQQRASPRPCEHERAEIARLAPPRPTRSASRSRSQPRSRAPLARLVTLSAHAVVAARPRVLVHVDS